MKLKSKVTDITHDDLVNLLSTALHGSYNFDSDYDWREYNALSTKDKNDCYEDKLAKLLLAGKSITICDMYAEDEDESYGKLPHKWDAENGTMDYEVTLKDIAKGIEKALCNGGWDADCALHLIDVDSPEFDQSEADSILQIIVYGETIYA